MTQWFMPHAFERQRLSEMPVSPAGLKLSLEMKARLRWKAAKGIPYEVGGLIYNDDRILQGENIFDGDKRHGFDFIADMSDDILAVWHTHPTGPESVSKDDVDAMQEMAEKGVHWPWVIVSPETITVWALDKSRT